MFIEVTDIGELSYDTVILTSGSISRLNKRLCLWITHVYNLGSPKSTD